MIAIAIGIAAVAAFILSFGYYSIVPTGTQAESAVERPVLTVVAVELLRSAVVASVLAGLLLAADWHGAVRGALVGLGLWPLPLVLLAGSVFHEGTPLRSALIHGGDWLIKLVTIGVIIGLFV